MGLLLVDGLAIRRLSLAGAACAEILGPQDLIRPWDSGGAGRLQRSARVRWDVLTPARVAVLGPAFVRRAARWPEILSALGARGVRRVHSMAIQQAPPRVPLEDRVLLLFRLLAARFGTVCPEGLAIELSLSHRLIAMLVGARRPSVTTALGRLRTAGALERRAGGTWLLAHGAGEAVEDGRLRRPEERARSAQRPLSAAASTV